MKKYLTVIINDFKLIFRDPSLKVFLFLPLLIFALLVYGIPFITEKFPAISEYKEYIIIAASTQLVQMFGFIYSMVLVDAKETGVSKVYGVTPIVKPLWLGLRFVFPVLFTIVLTAMIFSVQDFVSLDAGPIIYFSVLAGFLVPTFSILVAAMCKNRIEGLMWIKVANLILIMPLLAFFIPEKLGYLFGLIPTHWIFQGLFSSMNGQPFLIYGVGFFLSSVLCLYFLGRKFSRDYFN